MITKVLIFVLDISCKLESIHGISYPSSFRNSWENICEKLNLKRES